MDGNRQFAEVFGLSEKFRRNFFAITISLLVCAIGYLYLDSKSSERARIRCEEKASSTMERLKNEQIELLHDRILLNQIADSLFLKTKKRK
jgi:hypothetical protein